MKPFNPAPSPEWRTAAFYLSLFAAPAASAVLSGIWLAEQGLTTGQIGIVNAAPLFLMLVLTVVVGRVADRASDWSTAIVVFTVAAAGAAAALFLGHGFAAILVIWTAMIVAHSAVVPVIDAATMRLSSRRGSDFGAIRAWGTVGYLVVLVAVGTAAERWGAAVFLPAFVGLAALRAALALQLPRFRAAEGEAAAQPGATRLRQVMRPWFVMPLLGWAMIFGTHTVINAFMGLMWRGQGIGIDMIGLLIAASAVSEIAVFFGYRYISPRVRARSLILLSALVACLRWLAMALSPDLPVLFALQALHGVSYALGFLACVTFIARWTSDDIAAEAQGFFVMLQQAMSVIALYGFGWLMGRYGAAAWWGALAMALAGAAAIWWSWRLPPPEGKIA